MSDLFSSINKFHLQRSNATKIKSKSFLLAFSIRIMTFRTSRKLKNVILSINFANMTFLKVFCPIFCNILGSVGMKIFLFFLEGNTNCGIGKKRGVGRVSGNTGICFFFSLIVCAHTSYILVVYIQ